MPDKRNELFHDEHAGMGILVKLGTLAIGIVGAVIKAQMDANKRGENNAQRSDNSKGG